MLTILFDVTRLYMRAAGTTPTGIDRVLEAYGRWLLSRPDIHTIPVCTLGGVVLPLSPSGLASLTAPRPPTQGLEGWTRLVEAIAAGAPGLRPAVETESRLQKWRRYVTATLAMVAEHKPQPIPSGAIYLNVSHFGLEQPGLFARLGRMGVRPVVLIHDLIPILHPEFCSASAEGWHHRRMAAVVDHAVLVIANSERTAADLQAYAAGLGRTAPVIRVAPLGLEPTFIAAPRASPSLPIQGESRPYFACVGTLEPRKNLVMLLTLWRRLADQLGDDTPPLVLAGRRGWETEAIVDHLERSPPIRRFVHEVTGLTDVSLARLIGGAQALLSPSFSEGFNLPVAEALALGTPVIASDIAVHRELAPEATLIDPLDGLAWLNAILSAAKGRPFTRPKPPPTWDDHFERVARALGLAGSA